MKTIPKIVMLLFVAGMLILSGCNRNYYSGSGKGGKNCGCPGVRQ